MKHQWLEIGSLCEIGVDEAWIGTYFIVKAEEIGDHQCFGMIRTDLNLVRAEDQALLPQAVADSAIDGPQPPAAIGVSSGARDPVNGVAKAFPCWCWSWNLDEPLKEKRYGRKAGLRSLG